MKRVTPKTDHKETKRLDSAVTNRAWPGRFDYYNRDGIMNGTFGYDAGMKGTKGTVSNEAKSKPNKRRDLDPITKNVAARKRFKGDDRG